MSGKWGISLAVATLVVAGHADAATLIWDADVSTAGVQDGGGVWDATSTNWWDGAANVPWSGAPGDAALFGLASGAAGTVTVSGTQTVASLQFAAPGSGTYTLSGGTLTLAAPAAIDAGANATIASALAGTAGLVKSGTGTLVVTLSPGYTGRTTNQAGTLSFASTVQTYANRTLTAEAGATIESGGTLNLNVNQNGPVSSTNVLGGGTLRLVSTSNSSNTPDLYFGPDHSGTAYYGARIAVAFIDLGSSQRYVHAKTGHNSTANYRGLEDARIDSSIAGSAGITFIAQNNYTGTGPMETPLILGGANTFTGPLELRRGSVYLQHPSALAQTNKLQFAPLSGQNARLFVHGSGAVVANLESTGAGASLIANGNVLNKTAFVPAATLTVVQASSLAFAGNLVDTFAEYDGGTNGCGPLALVKNGAGTLTLNGTNGYSGGTTLNAGSLTIGNASGIGSGPFTVNLAAGGTFLTVANGGIVSLTNGIVLPAPASAQTYNLVKNATGALNLLGTISGGGTNATLFLNSNTSGDNTTTYVFWGTNTFRARINLNRGGIVVMNPWSLGDAANLLYINGNHNQALGDIRFMTSMVLTNPIQLVVNDTIGVDTNSVELLGSISGAGLGKVGAGRLTLSAVNTYTGPTTINGGTLALGPAGSISNSASVALATNTTFDVTAAGGFVVGANKALLGSGVVTGSVSVQSGAQLVAGGTNTVGTLTIAGTLQFEAGATSRLDLAATTNVGGSFNDLIAVNGDLAPGGSRIVLNKLAVPANGTYTLFTYTGVLAGFFDPVVIVDGGGSRQSFTLDQTNTPGQINLIVGGAGSLVWNTAADTNWDVQVSTNWLNTVSAQQDVFFPSDDVRFDDTAGVATTVAVNMAVSPRNLTIDTSTNAFRLIGSGPVTAGGVLLKTGTNAFTLAGDGAHDFAGGVRIQAGSLIVAGTSTQPLGRVAISNDALLVFDRADSFVFATPIAGTGMLSRTSTGALTLTGTNTFTGPIRIDSGTLAIGAAGRLGGGAYAGAIGVDGSFVFNSSLAQTLSGPIAGTGALVQRGAGTLTLAGENAYQGGTVVTGATLIAQSPGALGSGPVSIQSGQLFFQPPSGSTIVVPNDLSLPAAGGNQFWLNAPPTNRTTVRLAGVISGGAAGQQYNLVDTGAGGNHNNVIVLENPSNTFAGTIYMSRGTLGIASDGALGGVSLIRIDTWNTNGQFRFDGPGIVVGSSRSFELVAASQVLPFDVQQHTGTVAGTIYGVGSLTKQGGGRLILTGTNTYTGGTVINDGTLAVDAIGETGVSRIGTAGGAGNYLALNRGTLSFTGAGTNTSTRYLWIDQGPGTIDIAQPGAALLLTPAGGTLSRTLTKSGPGLLVLNRTVSSTAGVVVAGGTLVLNGNQTYVGDTLIADGTLVANGVHGTGLVTVASGGTLGGTGVFFGPVSVDGTIDPGQGIGALAISNDLALGAGGRLRFALAGNGTADVLTVSGVAALSGTIEVTLADGYVPASGDAFVLLGAGSLTGGFAVTNLPPAGPGLAWHLAPVGNQVLLVAESAPVSGGFDLFAAQNGITGGPEGDDNGDGWKNLAAYALGLDPTGTAAQVGLRGSLVTGFVGVTFNVLTSRTDITYWVDGAGSVTNGTAWTTVWTNKPGQALASSNSTVMTASGETNAVRVTDTVGGTNRYLRLRFTRP